MFHVAKRKLATWITRACKRYAFRAVDKLYPHDPRLFSLSHFVVKLGDVPGMITDEAGQLLFIMAYSQQIDGDIVEIGSWQGKSTICLARAALLAGNGAVYAIDHFRGNKGKESYYKVNKDDLSDLKAVNAFFYDAVATLFTEQSIGTTDNSSHGLLLLTRWLRQRDQQLMENLQALITEHTD